MYRPRNPYTIRMDENMTRQEYLARVLAFKKWDRQNEVEHLPTCMDDAHSEVMSRGMCCLNHLQQCIDGKLMDLAGCRIGIFVEPEGYRVWLDLSFKRLEELLKGTDNLEKWTEIMVAEDQRMYAWCYADDTDQSTRPGFSLNKFCSACKRAGFNPGIDQIAEAFSYLNKDGVERCWNKAL